MKVFSKILVALGVTVFLLTVGIKNEVLAQCDPGYTHHIDTVTVQGCLYAVDLCIQCTATHPGKVKYNSIRKLDDSCIDTLDPNERIQQVLSQVSNWAYVYFNVCPGNFPPCEPGPPLEITFSYPICWYMQKSATEDQTWYLVCDDASCDITYELCMKFPEQTVQRTEISRTYTNFPYSCTEEGFNVDEPTLPNETSDCYILHTPCNPDDGWDPR